MHINWESEFWMPIFLGAKWNTIISWTPLSFPTRLFFRSFKDADVKWQHFLQRLYNSMSKTSSQHGVRVCSWQVEVTWDQNLKVCASMPNLTESEPVWLSQGQPLWTTDWRSNLADTMMTMQAEVHDRHPLSSEHHRSCKLAKAVHFILWKQSISFVVLESPNTIPDFLQSIATASLWVWS